MEWLAKYWWCLLVGGGSGILVLVFIFSVFTRTAWGTQRHHGDRDILHKDLETDTQKRLRYLKHLEDNRD